MENKIPMVNPAIIGSVILWVIYGLGLVADHLYLARFGIYSFSIFKIKYFLTGLLFLFYTAAHISITIVPLFIFDYNIKSGKQIFEAIRDTILWMIVILGFIAMINYLFVKPEIILQMKS